MSETFLIRDRQNNLDLALWWKPNGSGYTINLDLAGRYVEKPVQFNNERHEWVNESHALAAAGRFVRVQDLVDEPSVAPPNGQREAPGEADKPTRNCAACGWEFFANEDECPGCGYVQGEDDC